MREKFNLNNVSIKNKLFIITTGLLIAFSLFIYLVLYTLLPSYYHKYKINNLNESISYLVKNCEKNDTDYLKEELYFLSKKHNLSIILKTSSGKIVYGKNEFIFNEYRRYILKDILSKEYKINLAIYTNDSINPYILEILMPLQPIDEATDVISKLMPIILVIAIIIGGIGAYIYSNVVTKPLIKIIERERELENKRKDFVATISHELKTPITIISGQVEGMIYNIGKFKDRDTYLKKSYEVIQELKDLVDEMVEVSKSEILINELRLSNVNFTQMIYKLVERQSFLIEQKNIHKKLDLLDDVYINCDVEKIEKAINNIINNAIKYTPNEESIIIRLFTTKKIKEKVILEIENTGVIIDEKYLGDVFEPFFRLEKSRNRKTGGSGLGLYLTSQILKSHNYTHKLKNKENSVVFTIEIKK